MGVEGIHELAGSVTSLEGRETSRVEWPTCVWHCQGTEKWYSNFW